MRIKHICFIVPNYPTKNDPMYTFVRELVVSISRLGIKCSIIAPQSITNFLFKRKRKRSFKWQDKAKDGVVIDVYQPIHFPFLNINIKGHNIAGSLMSTAIKYAFYRYKLNPDILYAHFWHSGVIAGHIAKKNKIPVFVATGESRIWVKDLFSESFINEALSYINGVISVSTKNKEESIALELSKDKEVIVIPNSVNDKNFHIMNKVEIRKKLGIAQDDFVVVFTGAFTHRKGILRLAEATNRIQGVKAIYIGSGDLRPQDENVLFSGKLPHDQVSTYLNAADVFVLPTLAEGCSNAIMEAMACGLPIISSNLPFNDDVLDERNSLRIDPLDIDGIANAIKLLKEDKQLRNSLSFGAIERAKEFRINNRVEKILNFMNEMVD